MKKKVDMIKTELGIKVVHPEKHILIEPIPKISPQFLIFILETIMLLSIIIAWTKDL